MTKTPIGQRNQYISIEHFIESKNAFGEPEKTWQEFTPAWAKVSIKSGTEELESGRLEGRRTYRMIMGFVPDITEAMRVKWNSLTLEITSAYDPDGTREVFIIEAQTE